jgi:hypothetical protein
VDFFFDGAGDDVIRMDNPPGTFDRQFGGCFEGSDLIVGLGPAPSVAPTCERADFGDNLVLPLLPRRVTTTAIAMGIPCPANLRVNGVCAGKLVVEPTGAYRRSASTRHRQRYGAKAFRFTTQSGRVTVPLNAAGRRQLRKSAFKFQFTLRLETPSGTVRQEQWTEYLVRSFLRQQGVG